MRHVLLFHIAFYNDLQKSDFIGVLMVTLSNFRPPYFYHFLKVLHLILCFAKFKCPAGLLVTAFSVL